MVKKNERSVVPSESCRRIGGIPVDELTSLVLSFAVLYLAATLYRLISRR